MDGENGLNLPFQALQGIKAAKKLQDAAELERQKERELFLQGVENIGRENGSAKKTAGFSLTERGIALSTTDMTKKKRKKKPKEAIAPEKPQPNSPAHPPSQKLKKAGQAEAKKQADEAAFLTATRGAAPLKPGGRMVMPVKKGGGQRQPEAGFEALLADNLEFALLNADEYVEGHVCGLDESILNRLRQGQFGPEAHLDLHGLNSLQAFEAVRDFIRDSWFKGLRTVLLVPGRGLNSPDGRGVLRQKLREWLAHEPFKRVVLAFCTAQPRDGGLGSMYVLLRNNRKKGKVYWERLPPDPDLYDG